MAEMTQFRSVRDASVRAAVAATDAARCMTESETFSVDERVRCSILDADRAIADAFDGTLESASLKDLAVRLDGICDSSAAGGELL